MNTILGNMMVTDTLAIMMRAKEDLSDQDYVSYLEAINKECEAQASILYKKAQKELADIDMISEMNEVIVPDNIQDQLVGQDLVDKGEITEEEYNELFQADAKDQFNQVEEDITKRSAEYNAGRPLDP